MVNKILTDVFRIKRLNDVNDRTGYIMTTGNTSAENYKSMQLVEGCITINIDP